jgi:hypothetical protein
MDNEIGPFPISEPERSKTGIDHVSQRFTRSVDGRRIFDGPVYLHYIDGRVKSIVSAGIMLTQSNAHTFADRAYYGGIPAYLDAEEFEAAQ